MNRALDMEVLDALERHGVRVPPALRRAVLVEKQAAARQNLERLGYEHWLVTAKRAAARRGVLIRDCGRITGVR